MESSANFRIRTNKPAEVQSFVYVKEEQRGEHTFLRGHRAKGVSAGSESPQPHLLFSAGQEASDPQAFLNLCIVELNKNPKTIHTRSFLILPTMLPVDFICMDHCHCLFFTSSMMSYFVMSQFIKETFSAETS